MKTRALFHTRCGEVSVLDYELPSIGPNDILVRNSACGICMIDVTAFRGKMSIEYPCGPIGHEAVGRVVEVGREVKTVCPGDWVVSQWFSEYCVVHAPLINETSSLGLVLSDVSKDPGVWIVEPVACVVHGVCNSHVMPGDSVAVVGTGFMGLIFLEILSHSPVADLRGMDVSPERLTFAHQCGAFQTVNPNDPSDINKIREASGRFDVVFECAGTQSAISVAESLVRTGGTLIIFAWHHAERTISASDWHVKGLKVLSITPSFPSSTSSRNFQRAVALMSCGIVNLKPLITHRWKLDDAQVAFETASRGDPSYIKGVILSD